MNILATIKEGNLHKKIIIKISTIKNNKKYLNPKKKYSRDDYFEGDEILRKDLPKKLWPKKYLAAFNLQLDDFSVMSYKNNKYDYGGEKDSKCSQILKKLQEKHPYLFTTIFVIPSPRFKDNNQYNDKLFPEGKYDLSNPEYKDWRTWVTSKKFLEKNELAMHGFNHVQTDVKNYLASMEYEFKNEKESSQSIKKGMKILKDAGIKPSAFKPPAWGIGHNKNFGLIDALKKFNFEYVCLSSPVSGLNWDKKRVSNIYPQKYQGLINIPQNINLNWDLEDIYSKIDKIIELNGIITVQAHFNDEGNWMSDGLGNNTYEKISKILTYLNQNYENKIWYTTLGEINKWWKKNYLE